MLLATPIIAEVLRGQPQPIPRTKSLIPVAFDSRAAEILGLEIPVEVPADRGPRATGEMSARSQVSAEVLSETVSSRECRRPVCGVTSLVIQVTELVCPQSSLSRC